MDADRKRRVARIVLVAAAVALFLVLSRHWPHDQTVHVVLGDAAPRVVELQVAYRAEEEVGDFSRRATFGYARGAAPRIVTHEVRLPSGDYTIQIGLLTGDANGSRATIERRVTLAGGSVSLDVSRNVPPGS